MNLDECLQAALVDARRLVEQGYWVRIQTYRASVLLDYGVIHDDDSLECSLVTKLYLVESKLELSIDWDRIIREDVEEKV